MNTKEQFTFLDTHIFLNLILIRLKTTTTSLGNKFLNGYRWISIGGKTMMTLILYTKVYVVKGQPEI